MKRHLIPLAALLVAALHAPAEAKEWKSIRIGIEGAFPPFSETIGNGQVVGFDIDIANALCESMQAKCIFVKQEWDGMIPALISRKFDAIVASMAITEERKQKVDFTNRYYSTPQRLVVKKTSPIDEVTTAALKGRKVGVQRGTNSELFAATFWAPAGVEVVRYGKQDEVYLDLIAGRLDGAFTDGLEASAGFLARPEGQPYRFAGKPLYGENAKEKAIIGEGAGIAIRKADRDLRESLNQAIERIRKNGTYDRIRQKYFDYDIYGDTPSGKAAL